MFVFGNSPGRVGVAVGAGALPFAVVVGGGNAVPQMPAPGILKAILTGFKTVDRSAVATAPTLRDRIYVWMFGEREGMARVSGLALPDLCSPTFRPWTGYDAVHSYFEQARANAYGVPVRLVLGPNTARAGFLHEFSFELADPDTGVGTFAFDFKLIPRTQILGTVQPPVWAAGG